MNVKQIAKDHSITSILVMYMLSDGIGENFMDQTPEPSSEVIELRAEITILEFRIERLELNQDW